jgi:putative Mn2+ efflux pump MntP
MNPWYWPADRAWDRQFLGPVLIIFIGLAVIVRAFQPRWQRAGRPAATTTARC